jgi:hypothetical protein
MTVLNNKVRQELNNLISDELKMVDTRAKVMADYHWKEAEREVAKELGYDDILTRQEYLKNQIAGLQAELAKIEGIIQERATPATVTNYSDCGLEVILDRYGRPYSRPFVFGHEIATVWDTLILKNLNDHIAFFQVYKNLQQLQHSVKREILLAGTFQEARMVYQQFHVKITEAIGDQMPKLLAQVESIPALNEPDNK